MVLKNPILSLIISQKHTNKQTLKTKTVPYPIERKKKKRSKSVELI